ncbi:MAG: SLBB domain-containing protein [Verrucomicrobia bacterium]|nr:SLBB domain-containing protein [Verrucomicrobiota bacterium]
MKSWGFILGALLLGLGWLASGCASLGPRFDPYSTNTVATATNLLVGSVVTNQLSQDFLKVPDAPFRLGPGDRLDIEVLGDEAGPVATFIGPDGKLYFGLLAGQKVWGLTLAETKKLLETNLATYLREPQVALTLRAVESQRVWVMGRVNTPGIYSLDGPMTVLEAITKAGGLFTSRFSGTTEELADLHHSFIVRRGQYLPVNFHQLIREGDTSQNIYLEPDDFIYLPSSLSTEVFVLGAVMQPRAVAFKDQVTLVSAIANARGLAPDARAGQIAVIRGSLTTPSIALVNFQDIVTGRAPDIRLQPRDIVYVPVSPYSTLEKYLQLAVNTFVRTVAANEGGRAVDPNYQGTGTSIPIGQ